MSDLTEAPETPTTIPVVHDGEPVLSFAQERFWFMEVYAPGTTAYTIPVARLLRGAVEPAALAAALNRVAARHGVGVDAVALAAVLANPWADVVLSGAVTPAQLTSNLAALRVELDPGELAELAALAEPPERYWEERAGLSWS